MSLNLVRKQEVKYVAGNKNSLQDKNERYNQDVEKQCKFRKIGMVSIKMSVVELFQGLRQRHVGK